MLSYVSSLCFLEYLEANKRFHITARTPSLRKREKAIPLHIENLIISRKVIQINNISFEKQSWCEFQQRNEINGRKNGVAVKQSKFTIDFFGICFLKGRSEIHVDYLELNDYSFTRLHGALKFHPKRIEIRNRVVEYVSEVIHPLSRPLVEFKIIMGSYYSISLENQHIKSSEKLTFFKDFYRISLAVFRCIRSSLHPNIVFEGFSLKVQNILDIIQSWKEQDREIGTKLRIERTPGMILKPLHEAITATYTVKLPDSRFVQKKKCGDFPVLIKCPNRTRILAGYTRNAENYKEVDVEIEMIMLS